MERDASAGPTLAVVAREAGVSVATASKVLNGREAVSPETRRRVQAVLDRLGYIRRPRFDAARTPLLVDVVVHGLNNSRAAELLHGVERAAHEAGFDIVVSAALTRERGGRLEDGWLDRAAARGSVGVLFHRAHLTAARSEWLAQHRIPHVVIDPVGDRPPGVPCVRAADRVGAVGAVEYLLALGHRRIAVTTGEPHDPGETERLSGYRAALTAAGLPIRPEYIRHSRLWPNRTEQHAEQHMEQPIRELLALPDPPTAVFAHSDLAAIGICRALAALGLRVPDDVSVVGFEDAAEASWALPALTTVHRPIAEMAATAMHALAALIAGGTPDAADAELPTRLVVRTSTGPPKAC